MAAITRTRSTTEWVRLLEDKAVPCGPINHIGQAFDDPQVQHRGLRVEQERYPDALPPAGEHVNRVVTTASPMRLSDTPPTLRHAPPALGQHTEQVLRERLGVDDQRMAALRAKGIV